MAEKIYRWDCPYCLTARVAFTVEHSAFSHQYNVLYKDALGVCGMCGRAVVATFVNERFFKITPSPPGAPQHLPDNVKNYFQQGLDNLSGNYDAAGAMFRTALEKALEEKLPDSKTRTLFDLIKEAETQQKLTPDLAKWANQIRLVGRDAVHKKEPLSEEDAQDLHDFTELVLIYLFTLPEKLRLAQKRRKPETKTT